jgi:AraC-like DNA-binding protein
MKPVYEKVDHNINSSFKVFEHKNFEDYRSYHYHPEFEIVLITQGEGKRFVGDHIGFFKQNDLVLVGENLPHCWIHEEKIDAVVIQFSKEIFLDRTIKMPEFTKITRLLQQAESGVHFKDISKNLTRKLKEVVMLEGFERLVCFLQILHELASSSDMEVLSSFNFKNHQLHKRRIDKVLNYIYENLNHEIDIKVAADILNMNVSAFCHYFKKTTNRTFSEFVNHLRIGYASKLLIETDKNISEIAFESGYNSLSNFNKRFKQIKGEAPKSFKRKYPIHK